MTPETLLSISRGDAPADLVLRNARIVNVFSGEIESADIAVAEGYIAGVGKDYTGHKIVDLDGAHVAPGLIDAHVHIESSLCLPGQFASAVVPRGVTTVVADPHEIANVAGIAGIRFMVNASRNLPLRVVMMAPSCVPATSMGTSGAALDADDLAALLADGSVHGLAEVMNFPDVVNGNARVLDKLRAFCGRAVDGHCPSVTGKQLNAYVAAGIGSDHECVSVGEAREKLARGMYILIREATNAHNLDALLPLITVANHRRICLCTDDRQPQDILRQGSVDFMLRRAIERGIDPIIAFRLCTLNPAEWFGLSDRGAIAPGRVADLFTFDDLRRPAARAVYCAGQLTAQAGRLLVDLPESATPIPSALRTSCNARFEADSFKIPACSQRVRVIGSRPDQLVTDHRVTDAAKLDGQAIADVSRDLLKIAVIERHRASGQVGLGFIQGIGLQRGAIAATVAHDHHNLVVIGCDDESMLSAARAVAGMQGGLAAAIGRQIIASLPLPVAGLMSDQPIGQVSAGYSILLEAAHNQLGSPLHDPFMAMSFMALEVIPKLKLTDQGLVDVESFRKIELFV